MLLSFHTRSLPSRPFLPFFIGLGTLLLLAILVWRWLKSPPPPPPELSQPKSCKHWIQIGGAVRYSFVYCIYSRQKARQRKELHRVLKKARPSCQQTKIVPIPQHSQRLEVIATKKGCKYKKITMPASARVLLKIPLRLNQESVKDLASVPGISKRLAKKIVQDREKHGPFQKVEDLIRVRGIGQRTLKRIRSFFIIRPGVIKDIKGTNKK